MTPASDPSIDTLLAAARSQFAASLPEKAAHVGSLLARGSWDEARRSAHKLRGSAATYGFAALGSAAASIEDLLLEAKAEPDTEVRARLAEFARDMMTEASRAVEARS
jgi:HPt (histidine-containing phosphotransfer) domain-containing protein